MIQNKTENSIDTSKINSVITEGYEKIINDYSQIEKSFNILIKNIPIKFKDLLTNLYNQLELMKKHFKSYFDSINLGINSLSINNNISTDNSDLNNSLSKSLKKSYEQISNEFTKIGKMTKEIIENKEKIKEKRKKRVKLLEKRLQSYCNEIEKFDFSKMKNIYDINVKDNEKISNLLLKNQKIEQYKFIDINDTLLEIKKDNLNKNNNKNVSTKSESINNNDILLINELVKINTEKEEEIIEFIETFEQKKSVKETDTIKRNIS